MEVWLSASPTFTSAAPGEMLTGGGETGVLSLVQLGTGAGPVPASWTPKLVDAPAANFPLYGALTAVAVPPAAPTLAFHAEATVWPAPRVQVTVQVVAAVGATLVTVKLTTEPLPHCESTCAVAVQPPLWAAPALPAIIGAMTTAVIRPTPAAMPAAIHRDLVIRVRTLSPLKGGPNPATADDRPPIRPQSSTSYVLACTDVNNLHRRRTIPWALSGATPGRWAPQA